jgi:hypothetical protein
MADVFDEDFKNLYLLTVPTNLLPSFVTGIWQIPLLRNIDLTFIMRSSGKTGLIVSSRISFTLIT